MGKRENTDSNTKHSDTKCIYKTLGLYGVILILGAAITIIVSAIYGIIGLTQTSNKEVVEMCPKSNLWSYVLVWVIIIFVNLLTNLKNKKSESDKDMANAVCGLTQITGITLWGAIETWHIAANCDKLHSTNLYLSSNMILITYLSLFLNFFIGIIVYGLHSYFQKSTEERESESNNDEMA